ncbi:MAG TPA: DUF3488 and transglutaminase-like domain-containing protein [Burkholderiaceae bacterium]
MSALTREGRDTLFLLATITATLAPHAGHLPLWCSALTALVLVWRGVLAWRQQPLPSRWLLALILAAAIGLTLLTHRSLLGREAGITLLALLMALKTLELRARRDAFVVFFLGFFLVLTTCLYSQSLPTALWMLLSVWGLLTSLVLAQMPAGQPSLALAAKHAARNTAWGLPLMVALFLLFPRIGPLWGVPAETVGRTGLSNRMDFGAMSEIANDDSIAMRLRFEGSRPPTSQLYFRGPVLSYFDGRSWLPAPPTAARPDSAPRVSGPRLNYRLTLEPLRVPLVPLLELGREAPGETLRAGDITLTRGPDLQWLAPQAITERLRIDASAWLAHSFGPTDSRRALSAAMQLPANRNPRTRAFANDLRARMPAADAEQIAAALMQHLREGDYTYTLAPGRYGETTPDLIDEFWLDRRTGFCEHYAASFVVILRFMGIPARIVTGFQGADEELQDGDVIVRNSHAHAWAEYWMEGRGWLRADPTGAVSPLRVSLGQQLRPAPGLIAGAIDGVNPELLCALRSGWESINNRWQQLVLNYSTGQQFELLKSFGFARPDWNALGQFSAAVIAAAALLGGLWLRWQARPHDAWSRQRARVVAELRRCGVPAEPYQDPRQWARLVTEKHGERAAALTRSLLALEAARYGANAAPQDWRARRRRLAELRAAARMLRASS